MKKLIFLSSFLLTLLSSALFAQVEICNNGIDDDFDGFIDCYDPDCAASQACEGFYIGGDVLCEAVPSQFPQFTMELDFASPDETTNHIGRMVIGDIDRDGMPEIVTMNRYTRRLIILNGNDGSIKRSVGVTWTPIWEVAIANINDDNCAEIFYQGIEGTSLYMYAYDCDLNQIWRQKIRDRNGNVGEALDAINYGLADFDGDGLVELYIKDMILDAHTGTIIINTTSNTDAEWNNINGGPVAVDILGNENLELVVGLNIYDVNLGTRTANSGTLTLLRSAPGYFIRFPYNATSVADFNLDGFLDVIASGSTRDGSPGNPKNTTVFFWDVQNDVVKTFFDTSPGAYLPNGWRNGTGRLNIADLDGDGLMNVSYVSGKFLYALDENFELLWRIDINEETSGWTGCTLFDFNGDGKAEIVYRDERWLYIINGTDGTIFSQQACISRTQREYPIVADVDADGSTELCVACGFDDVAAAANFDNLNYSRYSHVRVFRSAAEPWVPARRLWNQHGYFNVNVNDDLTIPRRQQKHHLVWSIGSCTQGPNRPLNNFLNQSPFLNSQGCPTYAAPDIAFVDNSLTVNPPTCPDGDFTVSFQIQNLGDIALSGDVPITFYNGDPLAVGATKLNTITITLTDFAPGNIRDVTNATVNGPGSAFTLFIVLNDGGTTVPTPITMPNTNFIECDYNNNIISSPVVPLPVSLTALKIQDNTKCVGSSAPNNGAVRAFIPLGATENTTDYNFYWSIGAVAKPIASADHVGATYTGLDAGEYTVYAIHKTASCSSDTVTVTVEQIESEFQVIVQVISDVTDCKNPNGHLAARIPVAGSPGQFEPVGKYTYIWYEGDGIFGNQLSISHNVTDLAPNTYTVVVVEKATGCEQFATGNVLLDTPPFAPTITTTDIICSDMNSGSVSANVNGSTAGFRFDWYRGNNVKPTPDYTTATVTNLPAGNYTLVVERLSTKCESLPVTVIINQTVPPVVAAVVLSNQISCDPAQPLGSASANVGGITVGFTFEWFSGQNTLPANRIATTSSVTGLPSGAYTVKATDSNGCFDTEEIVILNNVVVPTLTVAATGSSTNCITPNGSVTVNVSAGVPAEYTFTWYRGNTVKATTDFPGETGNVLEGLPPGPYTVRARHNVTNCVTAPVTRVVGDGAPPVNIDLDVDNSQLPTACNNNSGTMTITIESTPPNTDGFDVRWYRGSPPLVAAPFHQESGVKTSTVTGIPAGMYTIVAINRDNGCERVQSVAFPFANAHRVTLQGDPTHVNQCSPLNVGEITVTLVPSNPVEGIVFELSDYDIHVYEGANDLEYELGTAPGNGLLQVFTGILGQPNYTISSLTPGFYTFIAISKHTVTEFCRSVPLVVEIEQTVDYPEIVATQIDANTNCLGATANGQIELEIDGGAPATDYIFEWFVGEDTSAPALPVTNITGNGSIAQNLAPGFYTVNVINNTVGSPTACETEATFQIFDNPPVVTIASGDIDINDLTRCDFNDASATINVIRENNIPVNLGDYIFEWFDETLTPLAGNTNTQSNLAVGKYYVTATNIVSNCATTMLEFEIKDMITGTVDVDLISFTIPTQCLKPLNFDGALEVNGTGSSGTGYTYNWYEGSAASGPVISNNALLGGLTVPNGETEITYTVEVINNDNQCIVTDTYILPLQIGPVNIAVSTAPLTSCTPGEEDGAAFAFITTPNGDEYNYLWYIGENVKPISDFPGITQPAKNLVGLSDGAYTVVAIDMTDPSCQTPAVTVFVGNEQIFPQVSATPMTPVSNCDPARPNGVASASVDGNIVNYTFEWFEGPDDSGTPIYIGSEAGGLRAIQYTVRATDIVSGCTDLTQITIQEMLLAVPQVTIEVLSHVTSCISPNGALSASVNGNTSDYIFDWYIGASVKAIPDFTGEIWSSLDIGVYTVTATSKITGCVSPPASENIIEDFKFPDFDFLVENSACSQDGNGDGMPDDLPSGYVTVIPKNSVTMATIEWNVNGSIVQGPTLAPIDAGTYTVTVTSFEGCSTTKDVVVKTDIRPYNGISRNGDNLNYLFHINCIDQFPNNLVKIFNRAGTLVYEAEGYDNIDIYFDGRSNKGISIMGTDLPDGTYFYVIDKRDGSKPLAGYLEIVN